MEYQSLFAPDTMEHLERHFSGSQTVGSKFELSKEESKALLDKVEDTLATLIGSNPALGRVELQINNDKPVGRDALISLHGRSRVGG